MIERIHIEQLEVSAHVGVPDQERAQPQRLVFNVTLWPEVAEPGDDLARTVNYSAAADCLKQFVQGQSCRLIETLAEGAAKELLTKFKLRRVEVEVRKFVLPDAAFVAVTAVREQ